MGRGKFRERPKGAQPERVIAAPGEWSTRTKSRRVRRRRIQSSLTGGAGRREVDGVNGAKERDGATRRGKPARGIVGMPNSFGGP